MSFFGIHHLSHHGILTVKMGSKRDKENEEQEEQRLIILPAVVSIQVNTFKV